MKNRKPYGVLFVTVRFQDSTEFVRLANSFLDCRVAPLGKLVVADNSPSAVTPLTSLLKSRSSEIGVHEFPENPGYFPAAFATAAMELQGYDAAWVVIMNPDLDLDFNAFATFLQNTAEDQATILAPKCEDFLTKRNLNPYMVTRPKAVWFLGGWFLSRSYGLDSFRRKMSRPAKRSGVRLCSGRRPIYAPHGSIVAFDRKSFELLFPTSGSAVLYSEELWLAEWARRLRISIVFEPSLVAVHRSGHVTSRLSARSRFQLNKLAWDSVFQLIRRGA